MSLMRKLAEASKVLSPSTPPPNHLQIRSIQSGSQDLIAHGVSHNFDTPVTGSCSSNTHYSNMPVTTDAKINVAQQPIRPPQIPRQPTHSHLPAETGARPSAPPAVPAAGPANGLALTSETLFSIAGAIATLDAVENKLVIIKTELHRLHHANLPVDTAKVMTAFRRLAEHTNKAVSAIDTQCANLMRDAKLEVRFSDLNNGARSPVGLQLTMISIEKLLETKIASLEAHGLNPDEVSYFVDTLIGVVSSNMHVLSSVLLTLCAARDYSEAMVKLLTQQGIITPEEVAATEKPQLLASTLDVMRFTSYLNNGNQNFSDDNVTVADLLQFVRKNRNKVIETRWSSLTSPRVIGSGLIRPV